MEGRTCVRTDSDVITQTKIFRSHGFTKISYQWGSAPARQPHKYRFISTLPYTDFNFAFFFIFHAAQQVEGEERVGSYSDNELTPRDLNEDFSLSRVHNLRKMVHKAVMKDGNVFI